MFGSSGTCRFLCLCEGAHLAARMPWRDHAPVRRCAVNLGLSHSYLVQTCAISEPLSTECNYPASMMS